MTRSLQQKVHLFDGEFKSFMKENGLSASSRLDVCEALSDALQDYKDEYHVDKIRRSILRDLKYKDTLNKVRERDKFIAAILDAQNNARGLTPEPLTPISSTDEGCGGSPVFDAVITDSPDGSESSTSSNYSDDLEREIELFSKDSRSSFCKKVIDYQMSWNALRLTAIRADRDLRSVLLGPAKPVADIIAKANVALSLFGAAFYVPRTLRHLIIGVKHLLLDRSFDYLKRHSFTFMNDAVWATTGAITLGISSKWYLANLSTVLGPGGSFLTVALYGFDILNAYWKWHQEASKVKKADDTLNQYSVELQSQRQNLNTEIAKLQNEIAETLSLQNNIEEIRTNIFKRVRACETHGELLKDTEYQDLNRNLQIASGEVLSKLQAQLQDKSQAQSEIIAKIKMIDVKRRELRCHKQYVAAECNERVKIAIGMMVGMLVALAGPVGLVVGATSVLAMCYYQYRSKTVIMPRKAVEYSNNAPLMLQRQLLQFVSEQITRLNKRKDKGSKFDQERTSKKLKAFKIVKQDLLELDINNGSGSAENNALAQIVDSLRLVSLQARHDDGTPRSFRKLKQLVRPFVEASWDNTHEMLKEQSATARLRDALKKVLGKKQVDEHGMPVVRGGIFKTTGAELRHERDINVLIQPYQQSLFMAGHGALI